ncbi:MAG: sigma factor-like helix-turn-helix DNA-binding protein [archaeon]
MANLKKLNSGKEYELALLDYLGYRSEDLTKKFNVSGTTAYIASKKHEKEVISNLKGIVSPSKKPFQRGLEYILQIKKGYSDDTLMEISESLYKESLEKIKFKEIMETTKDKYDGLMKAVFGESYVGEFGTYYIFLDYLSNLSAGQKSSRTKFLNGFSEDIMQRLRRGYFSIENSDLKKRVVEDVLNLLSEREAKILRLYFGLNNKKLDLEEIGNKLSLGKERIRQIKEKGVRRLKHKARSEPLRYLYGHSDKELEEYLIKIEEARKEKS